MPTAVKPTPPSDDKRWKMLDAVMRRHGYSRDALIEALHNAQESFGYLDDTTMRYVAECLKLPLSKVFGVATFYHFFQLKPQGNHACVVCMGTACYLKGAPQIIKKVSERYGLEPGQTTSADGEISLIEARCIGTCALAPAVVLDGDVLGKTTPEATIEACDAKTREVEHAA